MNSVGLDKQKASSGDGRVPGPTRLLGRSSRFNMVWLLKGEIE